MQTFLPYPDFAETAKVLDRQRLGKQRIETKQILQTLTGESDGWRNHPAVRMWYGYEHRLAIYGLYICSEWRCRGYEDNQFDWFESLRMEFAKSKVDAEYPAWFGDPQFHTSHQEKLVWKDPEYYNPIFELDYMILDEPTYVWPEPIQVF